MSADIYITKNGKNIFKDCVNVSSWYYFVDYLNYMGISFPFQYNLGGSSAYTLNLTDGEDIIRAYLYIYSFKRVPKWKIFIDNMLGGKKRSSRILANGIYETIKNNLEDIDI